MPVGAAIGVSGLAGAAANVYAGNQQKSAADKATKVQREMYDQTRTDLAPYRTAGDEGTNMLMGRLPELSAPITLDAATLQNLPGYNFALAQGLKAAQSGAAARGLGKSGAAVKGATGFATGLANQFAGDAFQRELAQRNQAYNQLLGVSQLGANAATQTGNFGIQTGQQIGNNLVGGAAAQGAGLVGGANALSGAANQYGGYQLGQQQLQNRLLDSSGTGTWGRSAAGNLWSPTNRGGLGGYGAYGQF